MKAMSRSGQGLGVITASVTTIFLSLLAFSNSWGQTSGNVYVSRFWHNHQPIYWPELNSNGSQSSRVQYAWDSIVLKPGQTYGGITGQHPENNLTDIFGLQDRVTSYQSGPRNSLTSFNSAGGFAISYSGSLIDNVRQLGSVNQLGYGGGWNNSYKEARGWNTPAGSTRMDLVGFTYHHSLAPLLPKSVFRKELRIFKQAWWKAWGGKSDLSDHSKGYFPTEMAYSRHLIDVLVDEGYQWVIVPSHHISRTCPTYNTKADPTGTYNIYSSPPNKADQLGPSPTDGWWYSEPNPGNAAWNVAPYAYQLYRVKYVNPETGAEKTMIAVPSDDVLSYRYGYADEGIGKIGSFILPFATNSTRPVLVMPATDGDNAWGGGSSSWMEATPNFFNASASAGFRPSTPQDFVNQHGVAAPLAHIEDGAWIFPEMDYGSPNFMKWIEPPVATVANRGVTTVPGTQIDMETPGFALKFYSYAPLMAGANWCETAEQILKDEGGSVQAWKIQAPYDWDGAWTNPNEVEQAWHIYLTGLDSGFNYYGGLGNDDEIKPSLATRRAVEKLTPWMTQARRDKDKTGPTILKPQRFPYNPGGYTFGWFNQQPQIPNNAFLKRMNSDFYIWTHAYDLNGIPDGNVKLKVRVDADGVNPVNSNQNETYAGGSEVGLWSTINMNKRALPKTREALNAAAANSQIDYFLPVQADAVADYYFAKINDTTLPGFRSKLLDYYIEATDSKGNISQSEIQHVWVDDFNGASNSGGGGGGGGGSGGTSNSVVSLNPSIPVAGQSLTVTYNPAGRVLASASIVNIHHGRNENVVSNWTTLPGVAMTKIGSNWVYTYTVASNATTIAMCFNNVNNGSGFWDNNGGGNWNFSVTNAPLTNPPGTPAGLLARSLVTNTVELQWGFVPSASGYVIYRDGSTNRYAETTQLQFQDTNCFADTLYFYRVRASNPIGLSDYSTNITVRTPIPPIASNNLILLYPYPGLPIATNASSFEYRGYAGSAFTNGLRWSNALSQQTGQIPFTGFINPGGGWAWSVVLPLGPGSNNLTFSGNFIQVGAPTVIARDTPTNSTYTTPGSWDDGLNGGSGFAGWKFFRSASNAGTYLADSNSLIAFAYDQASSYGGITWSALATATNPPSKGFLDWNFSKGGSGEYLITNPASIGISGMGPRAFCLKAPGTGDGNYAVAESKFQYGPMKIGESLRFLWGINWDGNNSTNGNKGFVLLDANNAELVVVNNSNNPTISLRGPSGSPVPYLTNYGNQAMRWNFRMIASNTLQVAAQDRSNPSQTRSTNLTIPQAPAALKLYAARLDDFPSGQSDNRNSYFDEFRLEKPNLNLSNGVRGFGLWANSGGFVRAERPLVRPLQSGDEISIELDHNKVSSTNNQGSPGQIGLFLADSNSNIRFKFYLIGGQNNYSAFDQDGDRLLTNLVTTERGMNLSFRLLAGDRYEFSNGGGPISGNLAPGDAIDRLVIFNESAGPDTDYNFYVGDLIWKETPVTPLQLSIAAASVMPSSIEGIPTSWFDQNNIPSESRSAAADPDGDGWSNAQEFAFGLAPAVAGGKLMEVNPSNPTKIVFLQRDSGASYVVRAAADLGSGFTGTVTATASADQNGVPTGYKRYEATFPSGNRGFLKVEATLSP